MDFVYNHKAGANTFHLDTREIKNELDDVPITHPEVLKYISGNIRESLAEMKEDGDGSSFRQGIGEKKEEEVNG